MATRYLTGSLLTKQAIFYAVSRYSTTSAVSVPKAASFLRRFRPIVAASSHLLRYAPVRTFATRQTSSSLNDPNPNWSNRPPKETILLDGCDFEHWLIVMEKPEGDPTRDEIIDSYIKTLAMVVGSEEEARMKIYSVSTRHYFAFGALVSEELSYKIKELPRVRWVLPDSYLDVKNKDYGGEPFIDGQAVPYDPKYHEEWVRNNARANERNRRNDRPRNFDRSRNFERRRDMQTGNQNTGGGYGGPPPFNPPPSQGSNVGGGNMPSQPPNIGAQTNYGGVPPSNPGNYGTPNRAPNYQQGSGPSPYQSGSVPNSSGFAPNVGPGQGQQPNPSGFGSNVGPGPGYHQPIPTSGFVPNVGPGQGHQQSGYGPNAGANYPYSNQNAPNGGYGPGQDYNNMGPNSGGYDAGPRQSNYALNARPGSGPNQNSYGQNNGYAPNADGGNAYQNQNVPGRD